MRGIDELDHYELLEIGRGATPSEIDRAYRTAQQTYADGSLALYSVFESLDARAIRERIDDAYRVLADSELREQYNQGLKPETPPVAAPSSEPHDDSSQSPRFAADDSTRYSMDAGSLADSVEGAVEEYDAMDDDGRGEFDGVRLRRNRLFRGYEIDQISEITKVRDKHLRNIEDENFEDLPADVYVRGFVTAYAQTIGLDPKVVVPSYMARVKEFRAGGSRPRLSTRRESSHL